MGHNMEFCRGQTSIFFREAGAKREKNIKKGDVFFVGFFSFL